MTDSARTAGSPRLFEVVPDEGIELPPKVDVEVALEGGDVEFANTAGNGHVISLENRAGARPTSGGGERLPGHHEQVASEEAKLADREGVGGDDLADLAPDGHVLPDELLGLGDDALERGVEVRKPSDFGSNLISVEGECADEEADPRPDQQAESQGYDAGPAGTFARRCGLGLLRGHERSRYVVAA